MERTSKSDKSKTRACDVVRNIAGCAFCSADSTMGVDMTYQRKKLRYTELAAEAGQRGWKPKVGPVDVG